MKTQKYTNSQERIVLTGMILNSTVLGRVVTGLGSERHPFQSKWSNQIYSWCREFYTKYGKAPRGTILSLFNGYAAKQKDDSSVKQMESYLSSLSDNYRQESKELNVDYVVDLASQHFSAVRYARLRDELEQGLLDQDYKSVAESVSTFHPVSFQSSSVVEVFTDEESWRESLDAPEEQVLIEYPGALGEFFGSHLQREGFFAFLAPEKRGKSFWLIDLAWRAAVKGKRRTFFFSVGDMSKRQMMRRFGIRAARRPISAGKIKIPKRILHPTGGDLRVVCEEEEYSKPISRSVWMAAQKSVRQLSAHADSLLRLSCTSNSSTNVEDIRRELDEAIKEGWIPDVVVIDYADILAPESSASGEDFRQQTNDTWKALRRLSQDYHCLVATATQSDASSYEAKVIRKKHFSEDKRKLSHVTGMAGINQTDEEKSKGVYRLNWVVLREGLSIESQCVTVAGCLAISNPAMRSTW